MQQPTISWSGCDEWPKVVQPAMTSSVLGLRRSPKSLPKAKKVPEKGHGHCLVVCCWSGLLYLSESWWSHYIWEVCSANWWDALKTANACNCHWSTERTQFFCIMPDLMSYKQGFKSWANWAVKFCLIHHIHLTSCQPSTTSSSILTTFCRENAPKPAVGRKCFPRVHQILKYGFLHYRNNKRISHWQKCVDCNGSYFD